MLYTGYGSWEKTNLKEKPVSFFPYQTGFMLVFHRTLNIYILIDY